MKTRSRLCCLSIMLSLASCAGPKSSPISQSDAGRLKGASLQSTVGKQPDFAAMVASKAALGGLGIIGGAIGASAMASSGNEIVREYEIVDPAEQISREIAAALASQRGAKVIASTPRQSADGNPKAIAQQAAGADFVVDVRTFSWGFCYFPANWSHYRVIYSSRLRLIDVKNGKVIAEGFHFRAPEKTSASPDYQKLLANNAAYIKSELAVSTAECIAHFKKSVLGL